MRQIKITIGISNSGKSTWAKEQWNNDPHGTVVINRDKIRELLFGFSEDQAEEYYKRADLFKLEKQVTKYEDTLIHEALNENKTVIVDATHLEGKYINRFKYWNVPIELHWFDISLEEAFKRNSLRNRKVSEEIITKQLEKYTNLKKGFQWDYNPSKIELNPELPPVYLLDIDGTIAHMNGKRSPFDWKNVGVDDVCPALLPTILALNTQSRDWSGTPEVIIVSGRDAVCRLETEKWLYSHGIEGEVIMRPEGDMRPDWQIKEEIWRELAKKFNILGLFDDRLQVVRRARALGLKVFNVEYNNI